MWNVLDTCAEAVLKGCCNLGNNKNRNGDLVTMIVSLYIDSTNFESYQRLRERSSPSWLESIQVYWLDPRWWMSSSRIFASSRVLPILTGAIAVFSKQAPSLRLWVFRRTGWATWVTLEWTNGLDWPLVSPSLVLSVSDGLFVAASHRRVWCLCLHLRQRFAELHCETLCDQGSWSIGFRSSQCSNITCERSLHHN